MATSLDDKLHLVRKMAHDIQFVQEVLKEESLDPALAPQIAMTLQSTHHFVESQREMHYQQAILTLHQRKLDRQLSQRQHRESLQAIKYDPNWQEKLTRQRQQCWNFSKHVTRVWWEVFFVGQLTRGIPPIALRYFGADKGEISNHYLLKEMAWSILSQVCDCAGGDRAAEAFSVKESVSTFNVSWTARIAAVAIATGTATNNSLASMLSLVSSWLPHSLVDLDQCSCYGSCFILGSLLLSIATALHYVLKMLCLPSVCHHTVNLVALVSFYGTRRTVTGIVNLLSTLTSLSTNEMDTKGLVKQVLLFVLLFLQPLASYIQTQRLYQRTADSVQTSEASHFASVFQRGQEQMRNLERQHKALRYLLLLFYAALLVSGASSETNQITTTRYK